MIRSRVLRLLSAAACVAVARPATAQRPQFAPTLFWDAGLINTPAAYVAPLNFDLALNFSRLSLDSAKAGPPFSAKSASYNVSASVALYSRAEVGVSVFSGDLKSGLFGKLIVWDQTDGTWRTGLLHWLPSVAVGARNLGSENRLDRISQSDVNASISTAPTIYGVMTRSIILKSVEDGSRPQVQLALNAGYGNGLFKSDGGLGATYAKSATGGAFGGAQLQFLTGRYSTLSLLAENDGWGVNIGAQIDVRGLRAGLYLNELGAGSGQKGSIAYQKVALSVGWQTNFAALLRGNRMEEVTAGYGQRAEDLRQQIAAAQGRVNAIQSRLKVMETASATGKVSERADLEARLRDEQAALRRLQELLKAAEAAKKP